MERFVTVWCADWPVAAARAADRTIIVLRANRVIARSAAAAAAGVAVGQRRREAQRACPAAELLPHDPDRDARAFEVVVRAVGAYAPRVEVIEPGWLCLGARGPSRYFGGDQALARRLLADVSAVTAVPVGVAIADGRFTAGVAARSVAGGDPLVVPAGGSPEFLTPRPIAWLREMDEVHAELVGLFARLGLSRLGDLAGLEIGDVVGRFGPDGARAHRLASGLDPRPSGGAEPPPVHRAERVFDDPVLDVVPLVFVAKQLADEIVVELAAGGRVCTRLVVTAETDHGERSERGWYRPSGFAAAGMVERVRWQLEGWWRHGDLTAGVVHLTLAAAEVRGGDGDQLGFWGGRSAADERALRAITRLTGLAGDDAVLVPTWRGGRMSEERFGWVPASTTDLTDPDDTAERVRPPVDEPWPGSLPAPSPAVVLVRPRTVTLTDVGGATVSVSGRGELSAAPVALRLEDGAVVDVVAWAGPWPVEERWWDPARRRRAARCQVVTADGVARLVLVEDRQWWVVATYD
ncbi:MAG: DNA polymerase Y family protein [Desertimonas sp.]